MTAYDVSAALRGDQGDWARDRTREAEEIAVLLDNIAKGVVWKEKDDEDRSSWRVMEDEEESEQDLDQVFLYDYLDENFGVWCTVDDAGEVTGVRILTTCNGPDTYIDSNSEAVEIEWGGHFEFPLSEKAIDALNAWGQEYFGFILDKKLNEMMGRNRRW